MKKSILFAVLFLSTLCLVSPSYSFPGDLESALSATSITSNATTQPICRAVWVGTTQSIDLYISGAWVTFQGATAGTLIPAQATGARITSGSANPNAGDIVFLY